ncbi:MAG TPA: hypothetical protein VIY51_24780 [Xanthobacteraceae bacterium]
MHAVPDDPPDPANARVPDGAPDGPERADGPRRRKELGPRACAAHFTKRAYCYRDCMFNRHHNQSKHDRPMPRRPNDHPKYTGIPDRPVEKQAKNKKRPARWKKFLVLTIRVIKAVHKIQHRSEMSDIDACARYAETFDDKELAKPRNKKRKMERAQALQTILIDARRGAGPDIGPKQHRTR